MNIYEWAGNIRRIARVVAVLFFAVTVVVMSATPVKAEDREGHHGRKGYHGHREYHERRYHERKYHGRRYYEREDYYYPAAVYAPPPVVYAPPPPPPGISIVFPIHIR